MQVCSLVSNENICVFTYVCKTTNNSKELVGLYKKLWRPQAHRQPPQEVRDVSQSQSHFIDSKDYYILLCVLKDDRFVQKRSNNTRICM